MTEPSTQPPDDDVPPPRSGTVDATRPEGKTRLRIRFTKCGDLRWISHRDLARVWERLLRRAGLQLAFSQGFHPKPRISFPSALALGIEALDEVVELEVLGVVELDSIGQVLLREMPQGMELLELRALETALGKAKVLGASYRIEHTLPAAEDSDHSALIGERDRVADARLSSAAAAIEEKHRGDTPSPAPDMPSAVQSVQCIAELRQRITDILQLPLLQLERDGKTITCETTDPFFELKIEGEHFVFSLPTVAQGSIRPSELLAHVGLGHLLENGWTLQRTAVHLFEPAAPPVTT